MTLDLWLKARQKSQGGISTKIGWGCAARFLKHLPYFRFKICDFPYPIPDLIKNLMPYFRPEALEPSAWREGLTVCYGTYTVVGVNIKKATILSPNDKEVANSNKKHIQFKTRVHKPYPISDQNGRDRCPFSDQNGWKPYPLALHIPI